MMQSVDEAGLGMPLNTSEAPASSGSQGNQRAQASGSYRQMPGNPLRRSEATPRPSAADILANAAARRTSTDSISFQSGSDLDKTEGLALFRKLLKRPPGEVTSWVLREVQTLQDPDADIKSTQLFQLARAQQAATPAERQALARSVISGVKEISPEQRQMVPLLLTEVLNAQSGDAADSGAPLSPLGENFRSVMQAAGTNGVSQEERLLIADTARTEVTSIFEEHPQLMIDTVAGLSGEDRTELLDTLTKANIIPASQRSQVADMVKPGGLADQVSKAIKWFLFAYQLRWIVIIVPLVELGISHSLTKSGRACHGGLATWLARDSLVSLVCAGAIGITCFCFSPVIDHLRRDTLGTLGRLQKATQQKNAEDSAQLLGMDMGPLRMGMHCANASVLVLFLASIWAGVGFIELLVAAEEVNCTLLAFFVCTVFVGLRLGISIALGAVAKFLQEQTRQSQQRPVGAKRTYGSTMDAPPTSAESTASSQDGDLTV